MERMSSGPSGLQSPVEPVLVLSLVQSSNYIQSLNPAVHHSKTDNGILDAWYGNCGKICALIQIHQMLTQLFFYYSFSLYENALHFVNQHWYKCRHV